MADKELQGTQQGVEASSKVKEAKQVRIQPIAKRLRFAALGAKCRLGQQPSSILVIILQLFCNINDFRVLAVTAPWFRDFCYDRPWLWRDEMVRLEKLVRPMRIVAWHAKHCWALPANRPLVPPFTLCTDCQQSVTFGTPLCNVCNDEANLIQLWRESPSMTIPRIVAAVCNKNEPYQSVLLKS